MKNFLITIRDRINGFLYRQIFKRIFFHVDPEKIHAAMTKTGQVLGYFAVTRWLTALVFRYSNPMLEQNILGIQFPNPVGLAGGFDKNAQLTGIMREVGFGFEEVGSITGEYCEGNPRPRLWRLPKSRSLVVYYGLKNDGAQAIASRLRGRSFKLPVGINIAKTNCRETADTQGGLQDYLKAYKAFSDIGDYYTINISCPNAFGGEPFSTPEKLDLLLTEIDKVPATKPIFIKISPNHTEAELDRFIEICDRHNISGFVCTNLNKDRANPLIKDKNIPEKGSLSGKVVEDISNKTIAYLYRKTYGSSSRNQTRRYIIIGTGGIFSAEDAYKKIRLGASLVQLITGMIFEGPQLISEINHGLVRLLKKDGFNNISDAIGVDNRN